MAMNIHALHGDVPAAVLTGATPDISYISEFGWYEYVWYISPQGTDTLQRKQLGRYCGPSHDVGDALCAERILTDKALLVSRTSVIPLSLEETNSDVIKKKKQDYEESLKKYLGKRYDVSKDDETTATPDFTLYKPTNEDEVAMEELLEADDIQHDAFDKYVTAKVRVPQGDKMSYGTVKRRKRDADGNFVGRSNTNPFLDTSLYEVELNTGEVETYSANIIAEAIYEQLDEEGNSYQLIDEIIDHSKHSSAVTMEDAFITVNNRQKRRKTTKGWKL